ncbi:MAG TPA: hypothetical protein ENJ00_02510, partial [Phycisphaerales bacterium]|nr:hypothetical protein [Phycisphaerales bacterium]
MGRIRKAVVGSCSIVRTDRSVSVGVGWCVSVGGRITGGNEVVYVARELSTEEHGLSEQGGSGRGRRDQRVMVNVDKLFDRLPPHSLEAEMSLLGSMILDPQVIADVLPHVGSDDMFYSAAHS